MIKLLTCQTWVTKWDWFDYAQKHPKQVPSLLVDRSPCTDPFLDPYAPPEERQPIISGLCRGFKNFHAIYIYLTTVDDCVCDALSIPKGSYLGIAALKVVKVYPSHARVAQAFKPRQYVVAPNPTPYPETIPERGQTERLVERNCPSLIQNSKMLSSTSKHFAPVLEWSPRGDSSSS